MLSNRSDFAPIVDINQTCHECMLVALSDDVIALGSRTGYFSTANFVDRVVRTTPFGLANVMNVCYFRASDVSPRTSRLDLVSR